MCQSFDDPASLTPDQRRREIAAILAKGVLRLRSCAKTAPVSGEPPAYCQKSWESLDNCLDLSATSSPHDPAG